MSTDFQDASSTPKRRKINPATCTREELIDYLSADPGAGLSVKEATRRHDRSLTAPLFGRVTRSHAARCLSLVRDVALWLMLAVSVFALFFDRVRLGIFCLILSIGHILFCMALARRADRVDAAMQVADAPLARVLRSRQIRRMEADALVPGDIILLHPGDMIPADARLLRSDALIVSERPLVPKGTARPTDPERLEKDADAIPKSGAVRYHSPENMVFAGGVVESGFAVALVVAVGQNTHLGGLLGAVAPAHPSRLPSVLDAMARPLSVLNLCLIALVIPLTIIGIFTLRDRYELLDIVLSALSLTTLTLTEHMLVKGRGMAAAHRRDAAGRRDADNTADIKSGAHLEKLTTLTDLLVVGTAALHDGQPHPVSLRIGTTTYRCDQPDADDPARNLVELLTLYAAPPVEPEINDGSAPPSTLRKLLDQILPPLADWSDMDGEALAVKAKEVRCAEGWVSAVLPTFDGNRRVAVRVTANFDDLYSCDECFTAGPLRTSGRTVGDDVRPSAADERLEELHQAYLRAEREGLSAFFVMTSSGGRSTVHAMVTYAPTVSPKTAGCIRTMEAAGVRVSAYLRDVSSENTRVLAACGLIADGAEADRPTITGENADGTTPDRAPALQQLEAGCRAFEGCDEDFVRQAIVDLQNKGRKVAVLTVDARDIRLLDEADLAVTCAPSTFVSAEQGDACIRNVDHAKAENPLAGQDGLPNGDLASDLCRRRADVIVRRATETGGGIGGFRTALLAADRFKTALDRFYTYFIAAQLLRLIAVFLPLCFGLAPISATTLLLSGLLADVVAYLVFMNLPAEESPARRRAVEAGIGDPWQTHRQLLIITAVAAALPWLIAGIAKLANVDFGGDLARYGMLCLLGCQLALLCTERIPKRNRTVFFGILAMALLCVGALADALGAGLFPVWSMLVPTLLCVLYGVTLHLFRKRL